MQRKSSRIFTLAIAGSLLIISGCQKKTSASAPTKSDFLVTSVWKYSTAGIDQDGNGTIDITLPTGTIDPCILDNTITFKSDKTGIIDEGANKCSGAMQTSPFTWTLSATDTLTLSTPILTGFGNSAKVLQLTDSKFVLTQTLSLGGSPFPLPVVVVLVH